MNTALRHIWTIAKRELAAYFTSPLAYVFIVIFLLLCGFFTFFVSDFFRRGDASLARAFFDWHPWFYLFLVPAVGMRLWAEERRLGTIELLFTMPITPWQAIVGKFVASWLFLALALALTFPIWLTVNYLGDPENGVIFAGYVGSWLMAGAYLAISCTTSAMTRSQVVSFILALVVCLFLLLCGFAPVINLLERLGTSATWRWLVELIASFSIISHFEGLQRGVVDLRDVIYFLSVMIFALFTTGVVLRAHRAG
ncbi:MAG: ABC transporter permease [Verrucomicrobiae bacterium]|nr:ABC transporter permease [Verrucomicrobiae bacterium]MCX7722497.1 ABC transporter permease [Verrucomicrobiae bacterium]MDW7980641.1 ABC transporter permease [Verrucomicrobiales bacterium]